MTFEIDFNDSNLKDVMFLINELGGYYKEVDDLAYSYSAIMIDIKDFTDLENILSKVDNYYGVCYSAVISFDPPTIYLEG